MSYLRDDWFAPIIIDSTNNGFVLEETTGGAGSMAITVAAGTYYMHLDSTLHAAGYLSLLTAIDDALTVAGANNTYTWEVATPTSSTSQNNAGLLMARSGGSSDDYTVKFADASFTMDERWFGFATGASNTAATAGIITSPFTMRTRWTSHTLTDGAASDKRAFKQREIMESSDRVSDAYQVEWNEDTIRRFVYDYVPAAHVHDSRADNAAYATTGELATGDDNNAFETIWEAASRLGEVIVSHNHVSLDPTTGGPYEIIRFNDADQRRGFSRCVNMTNTQGEFYTIDVDAYVVSGNYTH